MNQRLEFVMEALKAENFRALCMEYGISAKTGYKWLERFKEHGRVGLADESRKPRSHAKALSEAVVCEMLRLKKLKPSWGPSKIRSVFARLHDDVPSESSFKRVLDRAGWVERRPRRKREESGRIFQGRKAEKANDVWTVDFKGWWYGSNRKRCEPLTVRDEASRYVLELRALPNSRTETVRPCFETLFRRHGIPGAIRSDNGTPFASRNALLGLSRLSAWWLVLGIDLERGRPGCPQDNPAHERFHLDVALELEGQKQAEQQAFLDEWRREYNHERPHQALGQRCPAEFYNNSERRFESTPEDLVYEHPLQPRKVQNSGDFKWLDRNIWLSSALAGWSVGVEPGFGNETRVWFGRLLLGHIDERAGVFIAITTK
jgi:transposase InsO family protein